MLRISQPSTFTKALTTVGVAALALTGCGEDEDAFGLQDISNPSMSLVIDCDGATDNFGTIEYVSGRADFYTDDYLDQTIEFNTIPSSGDPEPIDCAGADLDIDLKRVPLPVGEAVIDLRVMGTGPEGSPCDDGSEYEITDSDPTSCVIDSGDETDCESTHRAMACVEI